MKKKALVLNIFIVVCLSCSMFAPAKPQLINVLPRETDVPGWLLRNKVAFQKQGAIESVNRVFVLFGVKDYAGAVFYSLSDETVMVTVELMKLPSSFHSFGLFSFERGFDPRAVESEETRFIDKDGAFVWKGEYYIRVTSNKPGKIDEDCFATFSSITVSNIDGHASTTELPDYVYTFSENYSTRDLVYYVMGHRLLPGSKHVFVRKKTIQQKERYVFFIRESSSLKSSEMYNAILSTTRPSFIITKSENILMGYARGDGARLVFISLYRDYVYGVLNADDVDDGSRIMHRLHRDLTGYYDQDK